MYFLDVNNIAFEVLNYKMSWVELIATLAGLAAVWLSAKEHIANWGIGLLNIALSFYIFYKFDLYSDMLLQVYFFLTGLYGWWQWSRRDNVSQENIVHISFLTRPQQVTMAIAIVIFTAIGGTIVGQFHIWWPSIFKNPASFQYADTLVMVMSIFGNFLLTIKKFESWILWVLVDIIAPVLYFQKGMILFTIEYLIFLSIAAFALINWWQIYKKNKQDIPPQYERNLDINI
jgi:nicotinamide mononucleotide transporter